MEQGTPDRVPRGRHAPPLEVRLDRQRARLFGAAARVFARVGYAEASAEAISREAGMSKATFYEHFANKEECLLALVDAAAEMVRTTVTQRSEEDEASVRERLRVRIEGFLHVVEAYPDQTKTLLVETAGAGPRVADRRDALFEGFAEFFLRENERAHEEEDVPLFTSREDAYAIVGAAVELVIRQMRTGRPERIEDLAPVIERLVWGVLEQSRV